MKIVSVPKNIPTSVIQEAIDKFNTVEVFKESLIRSSKITEANEVLNLAPINDIKATAMAHHEVFVEDENFLVVEPRTHTNVCYYGQHSRSRFCVANPEDSSDWKQLQAVRQYFGKPAHFYIVFNKTLSLKNKNSIFAIVVYPKRMSEAQKRMSDEEMIEQGKARFREQIGKDISYEDDFLLEWVKQIRKYDVMFESYNSNNKIILPNDLKDQLGDELFNKILHNK